MGDLFLPILVFADNVWLLANNPTEVQEMYREWNRVLKEFGWHTVTSESTWCSTVDHGAVAFDEGVDIPLLVFGADGLGDGLTQDMANKVNAGNLTFNYYIYQPGKMTIEYCLNVCGIFDFKFTGLAFG